MTGSKTSSGRTIALLALAIAAVLWSAFLWWELLQARANASDPFCAFGDPGACGELWDGPFASWVHRWTGVPIAGWGWIWGIAALALTGLFRVGKAPWEAVRWVGGAGLVAVVGLAGASLLEGVFCSSCFLAYLPAAAFGLLAWTERRGSAGSSRGRWWVVGALAGAYLLALAPGLKTSKSTASASRRALTAAAQAGASGGGHDTEASKLSSAEPGRGLPVRFTRGSGTGDATRDRQLETLIGSLSPQLQQAMSDLLVAYDGAPILEEPAPRFLEGPAMAPVRIQEFTDTLCSHCATLFKSLEGLRGISPEGSFSVDQRHYPLDGNCNRHLPVRGPESVRCLAARAKICLAGKEGARGFIGDLYRQQEALTEAEFWQIAQNYSSRTELEACMGSETTSKALADDVELAARYQPRGTPLVIVNGKEASPLTPFLYALILNEGATHHPAFAALPAASPTH